MDAEELRAWRAVVARRDGPALVGRLRSGPWPQDCLQLVGDGVLGAVADGVEGSRGVASDLITRLRERDWTGDAELTLRVEAALGAAPALTTRPLPVDLEELADVLEGDPVEGGGRIDLRDGQVWPQAVLAYVEDDDEEDDEDADDPDRWLWVHAEGSRAGYRDMELFIDALAEAQPEVADRLLLAIDGRGAFRRFRNTLSDWPELFTQWHAFSTDRQRGRARAWLADQGYHPSTG